MDRYVEFSSVKDAEAVDTARYLPGIQEPRLGNCYVGVSLSSQDVLIKDTDYCD
jgi:hypothetical protein